MLNCDRLVLQEDLGAEAAAAARGYPHRLTVSNVGVTGTGESAMPVLVPGGGGAIVALGRARWVWGAERGDGKVEPRLRMGISWSADQGAELAAFVDTWRGCVEQPERVIAEGV